MEIILKAKVEDNYFVCPDCGGKMVPINNTIKLKLEKSIGKNYLVENDSSDTDFVCINCGAIINREIEFNYEEKNESN